MWFATLLNSLWRRTRITNQVRRWRASSKPTTPRHSFAPRLELLEDRTLLSAVSFSPPVIYPVGTPADEAEAVAVGDFNGDGKPDLAVANAGGFGNVSVLLGNGDGTFQTQHTFAVGNFPRSIAVGDINGDGKIDLAVANADDNTVSILLGNGDGTFRAAQSYAVGSDPLSVVVGDLNGDGVPDLAVANANSNNISILLGKGDGTFQTAQNIATGKVPFSVAVADFNKDGKLDLATANLAGANVSVLLGKGDGTFQTAQNFAAGADPWSVAVGDFDGDGKLDLAVANFESPDVNVLLGNGDGTFQIAQNFRVTGNDVGASSLAVGDFNGDHKPDLATASSFENHVAVLLNQFATTTAVGGPASSTYGQSVTYTATVSSDGGPVTGGTVSFLDGNTPISAALPLDANVQATFSIASLNPGSHTITASYSGTPDGAGTTGFGASTGTAPLRINPAPLSAAAVNFSATAGAPFSGAIATFVNADPFGSAASYTALIDWGDGTTSVGAVTGSGTLTVSGSHTYADPNSYALSVQISHNLGDTTTATVYPTATVTNLGQSVQGGPTGGIGFWHNKNGQALINAFNGGPDSTALSSWLATNFPTLYGSMSGTSNAQVAAFYQSQFALSGSNLAAEVLARALNVYATTQSLGGTIGQAYGFSVTATGLGADAFNVGADGAAFGVANNSTRNVYELLQAVDQQSASGSLYNGDTTLQKEANDLLDALNQAGAI